MNYFAKRAEEATDHTKRQRFRLAAKAERKGYSAKVTPQAVIIKLRNRKVSHTEFGSNFPEAADLPHRRSGNGFRVQVA